jgi:hypothetical protein
MSCRSSRHAGWESRMFSGRKLALAMIPICAASLGGCGTYTPELWPLDSDPNATPIEINKILTHVECELRDAVQYVHNYDIDNAAVQPDHKRHLAWLDKLIGKVTLKLIAEEKGTLSPGVTFKKMLPTVAMTNQSFSAAFGALASSDATRTENIDYTFDIKSAFLGNHTATRVPEQICKEPPDILLQSDLKIKDWLKGVTFPFFLEAEHITDTAPDTFTHEVDFVVMLNASFTPSWTLVNVSANTAAALAMAGRNTTGDVIITIGKASSAQDAQNIAKLNSGFNSAVKSGP